MNAEKSRPNAYEIADIFRLYGDTYRENHKISPAQHSIMHLIEICRTSALGGHIEKCDQCGFERNAYNSCRNRHCPKCQTMVKEQWLDDRKAELLPTHYFHNVFTLPHEFNPIVLCNKRKMLGLLFKSVNETLQAFARDPQWRLEGKPGFIAVLHTWNQLLLDHFHLHCIIPGGVLTTDESRWQPAREKFLFRAKSLAKEFKKRYIRHFQQAYEKNDLQFPGKTAEIGTSEGIKKLVAKVEKKEWIVYSKRPFGGPEQILEYLGRYTHRIAISNNRIQSIDNGKITFTYRDRADNDTVKEKILESDEFIRRFLLHTLPKGWMKIRYYGFMAPCNKKRLLPLIRKLIDSKAEPLEKTSETIQKKMLRLTGTDIALCPCCKAGRMFISGALLPPVEKKGVIDSS